MPLEASRQGRPGRLRQAHVLIAGRVERSSSSACGPSTPRCPSSVAYPTEKLEAFLAGHVGALRVLRRRLRRDLVRQPEDRRREDPRGARARRARALRPAARPLPLRSSFCTPGEAHEKGSVENLVGYVRRNALVPADRAFASFEELNDHLRACCERERTRHAGGVGLEETALRSSPPDSPLPGRHFPSGLGLQDRAGPRRPQPLLGARPPCRPHAARRDLRGQGGDLRGDDARRHPRAQLRARRDHPRARPLPARLYPQSPGPPARCAALHQADPVFVRARDLLLREPGGIPRLRRDPPARRALRPGRARARLFGECALRSGCSPWSAVRQLLPQSAPTCCRSRCAVPESLLCALPRPTSRATTRFCAVAPMNAEVVAAQVKLYAQELKMPGLRTHFEEIAREARRHGRVPRGLSRRLPAGRGRVPPGAPPAGSPQAGPLPAPKDAGEFDFTLVPSVSEKLVLHLAGGAFVKPRENVIFLGASGTGKTHWPRPSASPPSTPARGCASRRAVALAQELLAAQTSIACPAT